MKRLCVFTGSILLALCLGCNDSVADGDSDPGRFGDRMESAAKAVGRTLDDAGEALEAGLEKAADAVERTLEKAEAVLEE